MELKVWVEGIQRIVCGVSDSTTCQDVVLALAHAIGKSGKFTLIERWRNNERLLSPTEKPLKILLKWGEYSNDVQFILQHKDSCTKIPSAKFHHTNKSNSHTTESSVQSSNGLSSRINDFLDPTTSNNLISNGETKDFSESQYKDLLEIVHLQKNKISQIEIDLNNTDSEIDYLETRNKEHCFQFDNIKREIMNIDYVSQINEDQIQALSYLEKESELVKQQEKLVKSEIVNLRAKLARSETELLQHKNKIQLLNEDLLIDQRKLQKISENDKHSNTINLLFEIETIQKEIEESKQKSERHNETAESLKKELHFMESAINEKKTKIENLIGEMKEANLRSLMINPTDEVRFLLDNLNKNSSNRKIVGSPRQLENAVPTNKNPHGVWV